MRLGVVILPDSPWETARPVWQRAEQLGFDHAWTYDHVAWGSLRDSTWFGSVPTLAAVATATDRMRLGTLVASANFRHPVPFARELIALDDISGGRVTLGIGAGGMGWDATVLGQQAWTPTERADRFAEFLELTDRLLRSPETSYHGRLYSAHRAPMVPGCVQQPRLPIAVAATRPRGMRLAAAYGQVWVTNGDRSHEGAPLDARAGVELVRRQTGLLEEACLRAGREPSTLDRLVLAGPRLDGGLHSVEAFRDTIGRYEEAGVPHVLVHWPRSSEPYAGDLETFEQIVASTRGDAG